MPSAGASCFTVRDSTPGTLPTGPDQDQAPGSRPLTRATPRARHPTQKPESRDSERTARKLGPVRCITAALMVGGCADGGANSRPRQCPGSADHGPDREPAGPCQAVSAVNPPAVRSPGSRYAPASCPAAGCTGPPWAATGARIPARTRSAVRATSRAYQKAHCSTSSAARSGNGSHTTGT